MFKKLLTLFSLFAAFILFAHTSYASESVRLAQPKTPTGNSSFNLVFTALTTTGSTMTAKCFKQGPSDGSFVQFGSDIALSAGGNTDTCADTASFVTAAGTYLFQVSANDGSGDVFSQTVSVVFDSANPGTPVNYSKDKINSCQYDIKFKTANDSGETSQVALYRSDNTSFNADSGSQVDSMSIGSNTDGVFHNSVPDCSKDWYFAIRAFDSAGNGSDVVGDSNTITTNVFITPTGVQQGGAIATGNKNNSSGVLGTSTAPSSNGSEEVLGTATKAGQTTGTPEETTPTPTQSKGLVSSSTAWAGIGIAVLGAIIVFFLYRRFRQ